MISPLLEERTNWRKNKERWSSIQIGIFWEVYKGKVEDFQYDLFIILFCYSLTSICWKPFMYSNGARDLKKKPYPEELSANFIW
jgi:hypothetical protein